MAETDINTIARQAADLLLAEASTLESAEVETNTGLMAYLLGTDKENRAKRISTDILEHRVKTVEFKDIFTTMAPGFYIVTHHGANMGLLLFRQFSGYDRHVLATTATEKELNEGLKNGFGLDKMNLYRSNGMKRWEQAAGDGMMKRVAWSGERVSGVTVNKVSYEEVDAVVLYTSDAGTAYFVGRKGSNYCNNWLGIENYQTGIEANALLRKDVLYVSDKEILVSSEDQKHALHVSDGKLGQLKRVAWSGERVTNPTIQQTSTLSYDKEVLATDASGREFFVVKKAGKYYSSWAGIDKNPWQEGSGKDAKFFTDVLYVSDTEVLVSTESRAKLVSLMPPPPPSVWVFKGLLELTTSSTKEEVAKALDVGKTIEELKDVVKRCSFIDEECDVDGITPIQHYTCLIDFFDNDGVYSIIVEKAGGRRVITIDEKQGTNHVKSIEDFVYNKEPDTETVVKAITPHGNTTFIPYTKAGWQPVLVRATVSTMEASNTKSIVFGFPIPPELTFEGTSCALTTDKVYELNLMLTYDAGSGQTMMNLMFGEAGGTGLNMETIVVELVLKKKGTLR